MRIKLMSTCISVHSMDDGITFTMTRGVQRLNYCSLYTRKMRNAFV